MSEYTIENDLKFYEDMMEGVSYTPGTAYCGYDCHLTDKYGFVPEAGCPIHDDSLDNIQKIAYRKCQKDWKRELVN